MEKDKLYEGMDNFIGFCKDCKGFVMVNIEDTYYSWRCLNCKKTENTKECEETPQWVRSIV
jgi:hypothetical protein